MIYYLIVTMMIAVYGLMNGYIGLRGWQFVGSKLPILSGKVYWIAFSFFVISCMVGVIWNWSLPAFLRNALYLIGSYWIAAIAYLLLIIAMIDLIRLLDRWFGFIPTVIKNTSTLPFTMGVLILVFVSTLLVYGTVNATNLKVTPYTIDIPKQAGSIKQLHIALISDIHLSDAEDHRLDKIIDAINRLEPDIVLVSGDIIDVVRDIEPLREQEKEYSFAKVKSKYGVYAVLGNHDYNTKGDSADRTDRLNRAGVTVLRDNKVKVGEGFYLIGRDDKSYEMISGMKRMELANLMGDVDKDLPIIVMDHQPVSLEEAREAGADLQVSGHTHKGQFFPFNLITDKAFPVDYGYLKTGGLQVIVSSGAGTWGPPIRIGSHSEIVDITVNFK